LRDFWFLTAMRIQVVVFWVDDIR